MATNEPAPSGKSTAATKAWAWVLGHKEKIGAWLLSGGLSCADRFFSQVIPLSEELKFRGLFCAVVGSLVLVLLAGLIAWSLKRCFTGGHLLWAYFGGFVASLALMVISYLLFIYVESREKTADISDETVEFLFRYAEPFAYGMVFAFLAAALVFIFAFMKEAWDLYHADTGN